MAPATSALRSLLAAGVCAGGIFVFAGYLAPPYPVAEWLIWRLGVIWAWCALLNLAVVALGAWLLGRIVGEASLPPLEAACTSLAIGMVGWGLLLYLAGFLGLLRTWVVLLLLAAILAVGARAGWRLAVRVARELGQLGPARSPLEHLLVGTTLIWALWGLSFLYLGALTPEAVNHDAAWYHLPIATDYAREGRIVPYWANYMGTLPHLMSVIYAGAFLLPGVAHPVVQWMLALHLECCMVLWTLVGVAAGARWMLHGKRVRLLWAAFLLFPGIYVYDMNIGGSADHFLGAFTVPLFLSAVYAAERFALRRCLLLAVLAAGVTLTKYQSLYLLAMAAALLLPRWVWLLLATRGRRPRELLLGPLVIVGVGLLLTTPHFVKNIVFYGNPIYPFAQDLFTASHPSQPSSAELVKGMLTDPGGLPRGTLIDKLLAALKGFFTFSFRSYYVQPGSTLVGSLFTLLLPLAVLVRPRRRLWIGIAGLFVAMLAWGLTQFTERYLQILTPLMAVLVAALVVRCYELGWMARLGLLALVSFQAVVGGDQIFTNSWPRLQSSVALIRSGHEGRRDDQSRFRYRSAERKLGAALPPDAQLLLHSTVMNLGMNHQVLTDVVGKQGLFDYDTVSDARGLWELYRAAGVTHVAYLVGLNVTPNRAHDVLFVDFVANVASERRRFGPYERVTVPVMAPPHHPDYRVVCLGLHYRNGLYRLEQLRVYENRLPIPDRPGPPEVPWPPDEGAALALLARARAVVVGARYERPLALSHALSQEFAEAARYDDRFSIWIRR